MIKILRRKFIIITMCSIIIVLGGIIGTINIANYYNVNKNADALLTVLAENNGIFPKPDDTRKGKTPHEHDMSPEAPFETRYFTVVLRDDNTVVMVNTGRIAAVSTETAAHYAKTLHTQGNTSGFLDNYKYKAVPSDDNIMYVFLDCSRELSTFYSFLFASLLVSLGGILLVFTLVMIFSLLALKPVAESYEKQKQFITNASHEIKTPLTIISANADIIEMENGETKWTSSIKNQVKRLTDLTEKLVFLSRMDEENTSLETTDFSISDAIEETAQPFEAIAAAQNKTFIVNIEKNIYFHGDEALIRQLISLLLDNAMKYSNERGTIELNFRKNGKNREITVKNTVTEIKPGKLDILFERFYRADLSRNSETGGYGIGLSAAKAIVAAHKGKIHARSSDGKSVTFNVIL